MLEAAKDQHRAEQEHRARLEFGVWATVAAVYNWGSMRGKGFKPLALNYFYKKVLRPGPEEDIHTLREALEAGKQRSLDRRRRRNANPS